MFIFGLDFTSAPNRRKPITCVRCELRTTQLTIQRCQALPDFASFEAFLQQDGPWIAALDFPFGLPLKLLTNLVWPQNWEGYIQLISTMGKAQFEETLMQYRAGRPAGDKLHLRATDLIAGAISPMMLHRVPVGKMFFEGATRLLASGINILPCRPTRSERIVLEGYPALVARKWLGRQPYKSDERKKQAPNHLLARQRLLAAIRSEELLASYDVKIDISAEMVTDLISDAMGDRLDAVLCAIQAASAYMQRDNNYTIPPGHEIEGWIVTQ